MDRLTDGQVAEIAGRIDRINAGADSLGSILTLALLILVVLIVLHLLGYIDLRLPRTQKQKS